MPTKPIALIIHAGAGSYPKDSERAERIRKKLKDICKFGYDFLKKHTAVETVVEVVRQLEDWPETNAGTGAMLQSDGNARLSASLMDGRLMRFSGVINIENIKNPILVAKLLQDEADQVLAAEGANQFARQRGFASYDLRTRESVKKWQEVMKMKKAQKYGTVGACALDSNGHLAAATSTGGKGGERVGRVSDSALPAGNYANSYA
ncbi:MAG: isoaspartyl peptidase/L-asparaginase, partial [Candidatus Omnitrophica bacterium]|nr:isoaspartyl peptidase/L-asparaginase [Candidatus Omnitrophota bacterium]